MGEGPAVIARPRRSERAEAIPRISLRVSAEAWPGQASSVKWTPFFRQGVKVDSQTRKESRNGSSESSSFQGVVQG